MYRKRECIAMLLAGGQGSRLGVLTKTRAKPAVPFGGKYRIIDFTLSNCINSGIDTVGVLTQYQPLELNEYIGNGQPWDLDRLEGGVQILPPYQHRRGADWYKGTANAIYQNMPFIDRYDPEYVIILSGDHIYKMDYSLMLEYHKQKKADCTISAISVPMEQATRYGILNTREDGSVYEFEEKPKKPKSTLASMGIYIFGWKKLKNYLTSDDGKMESANDFGKNVIPSIIQAGERVFAYPFSGYWRDVGTIDSLWEANMDLLKPEPEFNLYDSEWRIYAKSPVEPPHYITNSAKICNSIVAAGCIIGGEVYSSVIFHGVKIDKGAVVRNSVIMPDTHICSGARVMKSLIAENAQIGENAVIGFIPDEIARPSAGITVVGDNIHVGRRAVVLAESMLDDDLPEVKAV